MEGKKEEIWYFLPYFLPPMFRPQIPPKGLTRLKFGAILYSYKRDKISILSGIYNLIFCTRKEFLFRWDIPYSTFQTDNLKPIIIGLATDTHNTYTL